MYVAEHIDFAADVAPREEVAKEVQHRLMEVISTLREKLNVEMAEARKEMIDDAVDYYETCISVLNTVDVWVRGIAGEYQKGGQRNERECTESSEGVGRAFSEEQGQDH